MTIEDVRQVAEEKLERVAEVIDAALSSEQTVWADCPKCAKRVRVSVPDWSSRLRAVEVLVRLAGQGEARNGRRGKDKPAAPGYVAENPFKGRPPLTGADRHKYAKAVAPKLFPPSRPGSTLDQE